MKTRFFLILLSLFILVGCCSQKHIQQVPINKIERDSVIIKETLRDTIIVTELVPQFIDRVVEIPILPKDTLSTISTEYATSTAGIVNNHLHHTIKNKPRLNIPLEIKEKEEIKTEYEYIEVPVEVPVPEPYIPKIFWYITIYAAICATITIVKIVMKFKKII